MPINAGDTLKLTLRGTCFNQAIYLDLTYRCTVGSAVATITALQEFASAIGPGGPVGNQIADSYLACLPPQYLGMTIDAQVLSPIRSAYATVIFAAAVGTNAGAATVACDSASVYRRTDRAGRNQISTLKIGPMPDAASAAGLITPAMTALLSTFGSRTLLPQIMPASTNQYVPCILSKTGAASGRDLTTFRVGPESRVMRRRVVGRGI